MRKKILSILMLSLITINTSVKAEDYFTDKVVREDNTISVEGTIEEKPSTVVPTLAITVPSNIVLNNIPYGKMESDEPNIFTITNEGTDDVKVYYLGLDSDGIKSSGITNIGWCWSSPSSVSANTIEYGLLLPSEGLVLESSLVSSGAYMANTLYGSTKTIGYGTKAGKLASYSSTLIGTLPKSEEGTGTSTDFELKIRTVATGRINHSFNTSIKFRFEIPYREWK